MSTMLREPAAFLLSLSRLGHLESDFADDLLDWDDSPHIDPAGSVSYAERMTISLRRFNAAAETLNACQPLSEQAASDAMAAAERADQCQPTTSLSGIAVAHKSLFEQNATMLERLDAAGAVNLGTVHTTEVALDPSGLLSANGPACNPHDPAAISGGSSSGSASLVAVGAISASLGTDTGGSVRIPAAINGVVGLKPTYGRLSRYGVQPVSFSCDHPGILAESARACAAMLTIVAGADPKDSTTFQGAFTPRWLRSGPQPLRGLRIGVSAKMLTAELEPAMKTAITPTLAELESLGATLCTVPDFNYQALNTLGSQLLLPEAAAVHRVALETGQGGFSPAILKRLQRGLAISATEYLDALTLRAEWLETFLGTVMASVDLLHMPCIANPTPLREGLTDTTSLTLLTRPFNYLGLPAVSVPCSPHVGVSGLPMPSGFQLVGRPFSEALLLAVTDRYETATPWRECYRAAVVR